MNMKESFTRVIRGFLVLILLISPFASLGAQSARADDLPLMISEVRIDQPSDDLDEYFELVGVPGASLDGVTYLVIGDGTGGSGVIENVTSLSGQVIPSSGYFVAAEISFTLGSADFTTSLNFENSDNVTHLLVSGFSGSNGQDLDTDNNGVLDVTPWDELIDLIALVEEPNPPAATEFHYGPPQVGPDGSFVPGHAFRCGPAWKIGPFDPVGGKDTPGGANPCILINEIRIDQPGDDLDEYFELVGSPGDVLDGLTYLVIGDGTGGSGVIESVTALTGSAIPADGYFVAAEITFGYGAVDLTTSLNFENSDNVTHLLVRDFTGSNGQDLDTDNDGVLDATPWSELIDLVALIEEENPPAATEFHYGPPTVGPDGVFVPGHVFRCAEGWRIGLFTPTNDTPGVANSCPLLVTDLTIMEIQGAGHKSPYEGVFVRTSGIVTALRYNGFFVQDPIGDGSIGTSDAIFVFTSSSPTVAIGDQVEVLGTVSEYYPGGFASNNLSTSELVNPSVTVVSAGNALPAATVLGNGGRIPPAMVIEDDASGDVETTGVFDPEFDGIDFYESLEAMLVQINDAVAVGPTNRFAEVAVVGDWGANAGLFSPRGTLVIQPDDFNPERILLDDGILPIPNLNTGDYFTTPLVGVFDYSFGNFKLWLTQSYSVASAGLEAEITIGQVAGELSVASFNVENLDALDPADKINGLAHQIVDNLQSPDIIGVQEIQDNNGEINDGTVDASDTYGVLIAAIQAAGGPLYDFRDIAPSNNEDGGAPGGNIRVGFLFRTDSGVTFIDRPGGDATTATTPVAGASGVELTFSPGRVDPTNIAFFDSRKPLAGEFSFQGKKLFIVVNHFNSKGGDTPLFGRIQPPVLVSEIQRLQQAQVINDFVDSILALDAAANVFVIGDLNDFQFSPPLAVVAGDVLTNLIDTLPVGERYTYNYDGNAQVLDNFLVSGNLFNFPWSFDVVHANSEFSPDMRETDHDPLVGQFCLDTTAPVISISLSSEILWPVNHKYSEVVADVLVTDNADSLPTLTLISVTSDEPDNGLGDGDTPNDIVIIDDFTFNLRVERSGTGDGRTYTITYQAVDACGNTTVQSAAVIVPFSMGE